MLKTNRKKNQTGIALITVLVFVLLSMLLALWASKTSFFAEMIVSNDADYQRTFEAAQALIQDAELDIQNQNADGSPCTAIKCREVAATSNSNIPLIPITGQDLRFLISDLSLKTSQEGCSHGLCAKRFVEQDFWNSTATLEKMAKNNVGARYGDYTASTTNKGSNPILAEKNTSTKGGWYWIEILCFSGGCDDTSNSMQSVDGLIVDETTGKKANTLKFNLSPNAVYRITALAYGLKQGTRVVLQQVYVPSRSEANIKTD